MTKKLLFSANGLSVESVSTWQLIGFFAFFCLFIFGLGWLASIARRYRQGKP